MTKQIILNKIVPVITASFLIMTLNNCIEEKLQNEIKYPPKAEKIKQELKAHNQIRIDDYYWLNERENPKVLDYLQAENEYTEFAMQHTKNLQEKIYNEIVGRIKQTDLSVPYKLNGYYYYTRYEEGKEYPVYCRKKGSLENREEIVLNVNELAKGYTYYQVADFNVSPDNRILAFGTDTLSRRKYIIHFKDLQSGKLYKDKIPNTTGSVAWAADNKTIFYTLKDDALRPFKIYKHVLGTNPSKDKEIFYEKDDTFNTYVYKTKSEKYIIIESSSTLSNEYRFLPANNPDGKFKLFFPRKRNLEYSIEHFNDKFYILTNYKAKNFRLMETPVNNTDLENWKEVIPHREDIFLEDLEVFKNFIVLEERNNGILNLKIIKWPERSEYNLDFGEEVYTAWTKDNYDFNTEILRFQYTSLTTPLSTYDFNMTTGKRTLLKREEVVGDFKPDNYITKRVYAVSRDGKKIPISLVYKKGLKKEEGNPLLLYGYGSYGVSTDPEFNSMRLSLIDRGFIYAIAHVRGGEELGREWYEDGKLLNKKNTFYDFIDCGEFLIEQKYAANGKLFALGGSAGGLLVGAVVNMRPDLFKAVIAAVPFVDVVTTMLDESIPLTTGEYDEWGDPRIKEFYDYMLSYSPYDNVEAKDYPSLLVTAGLHDSQVQYWEPAKWTAKLRDMKTDSNALLLYTNMDSGHSGASGRFKQYKEIALMYAFLLDQLNIYE